MKICIVSARFYPQIVGSGTTVYMYANELAKRGHAITIITDGHIQKLLNGTEMPFTMKYVDNLEDYAVGKVSFQHVAHNLYDTIQQSDFDILHVNNFMQMHLVSIFRPLIKQPVVFTFYNTPNKTDRAIGYFNLPELDIHLAQNIIMQKQYDRLMVGSKCYQDFALQLGADLEITEFAYLGIDHEAFEDDMHRAGGVNLKEYFGENLTDKDYIILLPGRIVERKGIIEAIEALMMIRKEYPAKLILTGMALPFDASFGTQVQEVAEKLGVWDAILCPQKIIPRTELAALYRRADVVITPSYYEGLGLTAIEALKVGRPLVATNAPGLDEIAIHEKNALVVPPKDSKALAQAIFRLHNDEKLRIDLMKAAPTSSEKFSNKRYAEQLEKMYKELQNERDINRIYTSRGPGEPSTTTHRHSTETAFVDGVTG